MNYIGIIWSYLTYELYWFYLTYELYWYYLVLFNI